MTLLDRIRRSRRVMGNDPEDVYPRVYHRTRRIDGLDTFYREAGPHDGPALLLLHGMPTSSHMYRTLIPLLADRFRVVAPDLPGFGYSAAPGIADFDYTYCRLAEFVARFADAVGLERFVLMAQGFGAPVGFRLAVRHPSRVLGLILQNAIASAVGLTPLTSKIFVRARAEPSAGADVHLQQLFREDAVRQRFLDGAEDPELVSPDSWTHAQTNLQRAERQDIQYLLSIDFANNVPLFEEWQCYLQRLQPPTLVVWGRSDPFFSIKGAMAFRSVLPSVDLYILDAGHFALETKAPEIARWIRIFLRNALDDTDRI
jgi:pimeloyl-ACP methyl ester carboxylesterase